MTFLGALTALGLLLLDVPFSLPFGIFTGLVAIVPFFGTLLSTTLPALFVLTGARYHGFSAARPRAARRRARRRRAPDRGNIVSPLVMSKKVDLPPVLTIMSVLVIGPAARRDWDCIVARADARGAHGHRATHPDHARSTRGRASAKRRASAPLVLRVPAPGGGVIAPPGAPVDIVTTAERAGLERAARSRTRRRVSAQSGERDLASAMRSHRMRDDATSAARSSYRSACRSRSELSAVRKRFAWRRRCLASADVLRGIDLEVAAGESAVIVGPPGAGKSTLISCAAGLLAPDAGELRWFGESRFAPAAVRRASYYFASVAPHLAAA